MNVILQVGAAEIEWSTREGNGAPVLYGISGVEIEGVQLMDRSFPSTFVLQGPDGWDYRAFRMCDKIKEDEATVIRTQAVGLAQDESWKKDQYDFNILLVKRPRPTPPLFVDFIFTPREMRFREALFPGFRLDIRFRAEGARIGRLMWRQHWEVGGRADGGKLYFQSMIAPPVHEFTQDSTWSNVCWKTLLKPLDEDNVSMQFNQRCAYHQLFDMLRTEEGVFLGYFEQAQSVQTVCQKNPGEDCYHVWESQEFPLSSGAFISGKTILFGRGAGKTEAQARNIWFDVNRHIEDDYRRQTGIRKSRLLPTVMARGWATLPVGDKLFFGDLTKKIPAEDYLEMLGRNVMPDLYAKGVRRFWMRPFSTNDVTELMFHRKADDGRGILDGDWQIGSCCCVWDYKPSRMFGGVAAARRFYELGKAIGMEVGIWVGNHLSPKAPILREHPEWVLKSAGFDNPSGGYDPFIIAVVDWNSGAREWILNDLLAWKANCGLDFVFFDSFGNLGLKSRNYARDDLADNFKGVMKFLAALTAAGIDVIVEGRSFIGSPYFGIANDGNMQSEVDPLIGQNSLGWYLGEEDMLTGCQVFTSHNAQVDRDRLVGMHFRAMANAGMITVHGGPETLWDHIRIYNRLNAHMETRTILEDGLGVVWDSQAGTRVFFACREGTFPLNKKKSVRQVMADGFRDLGKTTRLSVRPCEAYLIE